MPRRVALPGAEELFRPTEPVTDAGRRHSGRVKHDEKITVYVSGAELPYTATANLNREDNNTITFPLPDPSGYLHTGWVDRIPTLLVSGFSLVIAVLSFFSGLILDVVANKYRQLFQLQLIDTQSQCEQRRRGTDEKPDGA